LQRHLHRWLTLTWLTVGLGAGFCGTASAEAPPGNIAVQHWTVDDGLPQGSVTAIAQTDDGFLWLATFGGLVRFDGVNIVTQPGAPAEHGTTFRVTALVADPAGGLWAGLQDGGLVRYRDGVWSRPPQPAPLQTATVWSLAMGPEGPWAATQAGLAVAGPKGEVRLRPLGAVAAKGEAVTAATVVGRTGYVADPEGVLRVADRARRILRDGGGVSALTHEADGVVWFVRDSGIGALVDGQLLSSKFQTRTDHPWALEVDASGTLWMAADAGLFRVGQTAELLRKMRGELPFEPKRWPGIPGGARSLFLDREGNLWVGTNGSGFYRLRFDRFGRYAPVGESSAAGIVSLGDAGVLFGVGCKALAVLRGGRVEIPLTVDAEGCVAALAVDAAGHLWVGGGSVLSEYRLAAGSWELVHRRKLPAPVAALAAGSSGLFVGTRGLGVAVIDGDQTRWITADEGLGHAHVTALQVLGDVVYVGHPSGTSVIRPTGTHALTELQGHPPGSVRALLPEEDGTVWIGTYGGGLARWHRGEFQRFTRADGLYDNVVSSVLDDGKGGLWMNGNRGVSHVARAELTAFSRGEIKSIRASSFATGEGNGFVQPTGWRSETGQMFFPTVDGIVQLDLDSLPVNRTAPSVFIESATLDGTGLRVGASNVVPPGDGELFVRFTSPSLTRPELLRFQYQLSGGEGAPWVAPDGGRSLRLRGLEPGEYTLSVHATNENDVVSSQVATLRFTLQPAFRQTLLFKILLVIGLVAFGILVQTVRTRRLRRHARALAEEVEQRKAAEVALREEGERRLELERKLGQAQRMEAIGTLAGGVAHDFNNLLTVIKNYADLLQREIGAGAEGNAGEFVAEISRCAERAAKLTRQLLAFGRRQRLQPVATSPAEILRALVPMLRRLGPDGIDVQLEVQGDPGYVHADPTGLENALVNLVLNAAQAAEGAAAVQIDVSRVPAEGEGLGMVRIDVSDTGPGIPSGVLPRIFEPFYTTKEVGQGTGLGLASVHGFVNQSEGHISVASTRGEGARFEILLPAVPPPPQPERKPEPVAPKVTPRVVLLVDDDAPVRRSLRRLLRSRRIDVKQAGGGEEALQILDAEGSAIGALITDVRMPGMSGTELVARARAGHPHLAVLFITGHVTPTLVAELEGDGGRVMEKPFEPEALLAVVEEMLV
jgi:signal transduction histidine kinase/ligand-binding sensor domain-containing protein/CheY-like chemotaxis protein